MLLAVMSYPTKNKLAIKVNGKHTSFMKLDPSNYKQKEYQMLCSEFKAHREKYVSYPVIESELNSLMSITINTASGMPLCLLNDGNTSPYAYYNGSGVYATLIEVMAENSGSNAIRVSDLWFSESRVTPVGVCDVNFDLSVYPPVLALTPKNSETTTMVIVLENSEEQEYKRIMHINSRKVVKLQSSDDKVVYEVMCGDNYQTAGINHGYEQRCLMKYPNLLSYNLCIMWPGVGKFITAILLAWGLIAWLSKIHAFVSISALLQFPTVYLTYTLSKLPVKYLFCRYCKLPRGPTHKCESECICGDTAAITNRSEHGAKCNLSKGKFDFQQLLGSPLNHKINRYINYIVILLVFLSVLPVGFADKQAVKKLEYDVFGKFENNGGVSDLSFSFKKLGMITTYNFTIPFRCKEQEELVITMYNRSISVYKYYTDCTTAPTKVLLDTDCDELADLGKCDEVLVQALSITGILFEDWDYYIIDKHFKPLLDYTKGVVTYNYITKNLNKVMSKARNDRYGSIRNGAVYELKHLLSMNTSDWMKTAQENPDELWMDVEAIIPFVATIDTDTDVLHMVGSQVLKAGQGVHGKTTYNGVQKSEFDVKVWMPFIKHTLVFTELYETCKPSSIHTVTNEKCFGNCNACFAEISDATEGKNKFCAENVNNWGCEPAYCMGISSGSLCGICDYIRSADCGKVGTIHSQQTELMVCGMFKGTIECDTMMPGESKTLKNGISIGTSFSSKDSFEQVSGMVFMYKGSLYYGQIARPLEDVHYFGWPQYKQGKQVLTKSVSFDWSCSFWNHHIVSVENCGPNTFNQLKGLKKFNRIDMDRNGLDTISDAEILFQFSTNIGIDEYEFEQTTHDFSGIKAVCNGCFACVQGLVCSLKFTDTVSSMTKLSCDNVYSIPSSITTVPGLNSHEVVLFVNTGSTPINCKLGGVKFQITDITWDKEDNFINDKNQNLFNRYESLYNIDWIKNVEAWFSGNSYAHYFKITFISLFCVLFVYLMYMLIFYGSKIGDVYHNLRSSHSKNMVKLKQQRDRRREIIRQREKDKALKDGLLNSKPQ